MPMVDGAMQYEILHALRRTVSAHMDHSPGTVVTKLSKLMTAEYTKDLQDCLPQQ